LLSDLQDNAKLQSKNRSWKSSKQHLGKPWYACNNYIMVLTMATVSSQRQALRGVPSGFEDLHSWGCTLSSRHWEVGKGPAESWNLWNSWMLVGCQVLSQAGFDAGALLQQAQSQHVKDELRRRTNEVRLRLLVKCFNWEWQQCICTSGIFVHYFPERN
jgi:hypothetical protein